MGEKFHKADAENGISDVIAKIDPVAEAIKRLPDFIWAVKRDGKYLGTKDQVLVFTHHKPAKEFLEARGITRHYSLAHMAWSALISECEGRFERVCINAVSGRVYDVVLPLALLLSRKGGEHDLEANSLP